MLIMQQPQETFPDGCKGLQVRKDPTDWSLQEKEPGGSESMGEAGQVHGKVGGVGAVTPDHTEDLLHGHPLVSPLPGM